MTSTIILKTFYLTETETRTQKHEQNSFRVILNVKWLIWSFIYFHSKTSFLPGRKKVSILCSSVGTIPLVNQIKLVARFIICDFTPISTLLPKTVFENQIFKLILMPSFLVKQTLKTVFIPCNYITMNKLIVAYLWRQIYPQQWFIQEIWI